MDREETKRLARTLQGLRAEDILARTLERFGTGIALATSFGAEDQVLTDMLCGLSSRARIFTLDTGRLPPETYDLMEETERRYGIRIKVLFPDREAVEQMVAEHGANLFRKSVELRRRCCRVRKVIPLQRELSNLDAWITGLRREQSVTRGAVEAVEWDEENGLVKVNPLWDWKEERVWAYIRERGVPYSALHDRGYPSIGCAPCTRAVRRTEDVRAGRWWWEEPEHRECGLHRRGPETVRIEPAARPKEG